MWIPFVLFVFFPFLFLIFLVCLTFVNLFTLGLSVCLIVFILFGRSLQPSGHGPVLVCAFLPEPSPFPICGKIFFHKTGAKKVGDLVSLNGTFCTSWVQVAVSFPMLRKFPAIISSNIFSSSFSL